MEDNERIVRRLIEECVNTNQPDLLPSFVDPDVRIHPGTPGAAPDTDGIDELRQAFRRFHQVFPDLHVVLDEVITTDDMVVSRWTAAGTDRAELAGDSRHRKVRALGRNRHLSAAGGRVAEWWRNEDFVGLLQQLGHDPRP